MTRPASVSLAAYQQKLVLRSCHVAEADLVKAEREENRAVGASSAAFSR
jgi:hypothetical protein